MQSLRSSRFQCLYSCPSSARSISILIKRRCLRKGKKTSVTQDKDKNVTKKAINAFICRTHLLVSSPRQTAPNPLSVPFSGDWRPAFRQPGAVQHNLQYVVSLSFPVFCLQHNLHYVVNFRREIFYITRFWYFACVCGICFSLHSLKVSFFYSLFTT